jgi:hypothetical protein
MHNSIQIIGNLGRDQSSARREPLALRSRCCPSPRGVLGRTRKASGSPEPIGTASFVSIACMLPLQIFAVAIKSSSPARS